MSYQKDRKQSTGEVLFDTEKVVVKKFYYNDSYMSLIRLITHYLNMAPITDTYFKVLFLEKLWAWFEIDSVYLLGLQRDLAFVTKQQQQLAAVVDAATATEAKNKKEKNRMKKQEKKNGIIRKVEAAIGAEIIYVFGKANAKVKPERYFKNAQFLGFTESYGGNLDARVGSTAMYNAVNKIFNFLKTDPAKCEPHAFTIVISVSEGIRFKPVYHYVKGAIDEPAEPWVGEMVQFWDGFSKIARKHTQDHKTFKSEEVMTLDLVKGRKADEHADWVYSMMSILHDYRKDSSTATPPSIERPRRGPIMDLTGVEALAFYLPYASAVSHKPLEEVDFGVYELETMYLQQEFDSQIAEHEELSKETAQVETTAKAA